MQVFSHPMKCLAVLHLALYLLLSDGTRLYLTLKTAFEHEADMQLISTPFRMQQSGSEGGLC